MTAQYDWSKLPVGWRYHRDETYADEYLTGPGRLTYNVQTAEYYEQCRDVLRACRIPESKLEGSGWSYDSTFDTIEKPIESGLTWRYWPRTGLFSAQLKMGVKPDAESAKTAYLEAYALVAKCKRDWRDEVMGAAPIPAEWGSGELHAFTDAIIVHPLPGKMKLTCNPDRSMDLDGEADLVGCLRLSIVIERLKKLGWREA